MVLPCSGPFLLRAVSAFFTPEISLICAGPTFDRKFPLPAGGPCGIIARPLLSTSPRAGLMTQPGHVQYLGD